MITVSRGWKGKAYWKGRIEGKEDGRYRVKITEVHAPIWNLGGIHACRYTGNEFINSSSIGTEIWIDEDIPN